MQSYAVITANDPEILQQSVREMLEVDYKPIGGVLWHMSQ